MGDDSSLTPAGAESWARRQINLLVPSTPCPVCAYPIRVDECEELTQCSRCRADYHTPCFWRVLPLEDWLAYWNWLNDLTDDSNHSYGRYFCATCRQFDGIGK